MPKNGVKNVQEEKKFVILNTLNLMLSESHI